MICLALLFLFITAVSSIYQGTPMEVASQINNRVKELFNAGSYPQLVQEFFHTDAVLTNGIDPPANGHAEIEAYLRSTEEYGQLEDVKVVSVENGGNPNLITATVELKQGTTIELHVTEKIKDGKFSNVVIVVKKE